MFEIELIIHMKIDLALNNLQGLICHKTQPTNQSIKFLKLSIFKTHTYLFNSLTQILAVKIKYAANSDDY